MAAAWAAWAWSLSIELVVALSSGASCDGNATASAHTAWHAARRSGRLSFAQTSASSGRSPLISASRASVATPRSASSSCAVSLSAPIITGSDAPFAVAAAASAAAIARCERSERVSPSPARRTWVTHSVGWRPPPWALSIVRSCSTMKAEWRSRVGVGISPRRRTIARATPTRHSRVADGRRKGAESTAATASIADAASDPPLLITFLRLKPFGPLPGVVELARARAKGTARAAARTSPSASAAPARTAGATSSSALTQSAVAPSSTSPCHSPSALRTNGGSARRHATLISRGTERSPSTAFRFLSSSDCTFSSMPPEPSSAALTAPHAARRSGSAESRVSLMSTPIASCVSCTMFWPWTRHRSPSTTATATLAATVDAGEFFGPSHERSEPTVVYSVCRAPRAKM